MKTDISTRLDEDNQRLARITKIVRNVKARSHADPAARLVHLKNIELRTRAGWSVWMREAEIDLARCHDRDLERAKDEVSEALGDPASW